MMSTNTKGWLKLAKEPLGLLTVSVRHFDSSTLSLIVRIVLQRGVQGTQPKESQRNRCPQEGPHGQREGRGIYLMFL